VVAVATNSEARRTLWLTAICTGCRPAAEILTLKQQDIDLRRSTLTVQAAFAKNDAAKTAPLVSTLLKRVRRQMEWSQSEWVFVPKDRRTPMRDAETPRRKNSFRDCPQKC
jgi:integrase